MEGALKRIETHWRPIVVIAWLLMCAWMLYHRSGAIQAFTLSDTDDNLRFAQVRALLDGQAWFDLRQYRFAPPQGADIHWSRLVDLPLAGLILLLRPLLGGPEAQRWAAALAPMLPLLLALFSLSLATRRLVSPIAYPFVIVAFFFAGSANGMFAPMRLDHHGWQLAFLATVLAGLADPKRARGGATVGIASALSLAIGMEMVIYLALAGIGITLSWVASDGERRRLAAYAATMSGGAALAFLLFASRANRLAVCDALSPVWLSDALVAGALLLGLAAATPARWTVRLGVAVAAGLLLAAFHAFAWPQCLTRLEGVSEEVERLWLSNVREARPVYSHGVRSAVLILAIPLTGLVGTIILAWRARLEPGLARRVLPILALAAVSTGLLFWQTRAGPAAQLIGTLGATSFLWLLRPLAARIENGTVRILATVAVTLAGLGAIVPLIVNLTPAEKVSEARRAVLRANRACTSLPGLRPVAQQPRGLVFTYIDLGPRLIAVTHHDAVTGPYHRNGQAIADVMNAFRGGPDQARLLIARYKADYLLICPNMSTATVFKSAAPKGFYAQLEAGRIPAWLEPISLPKDSPFRMWRVVKPDPSAGQPD